MVLWLWNERGAHRIEDPRVVPTFFLHAPPSELPEIRRRIEILDGVREVRDVSKRIALEDDEPKPVLEIVPRHYRDIRGLAHILDSNGGDRHPRPVYRSPRPAHTNRRRTRQLPHGGRPTPRPGRRGNRRASAPRARRT